MGDIFPLVFLAEHLGDIGLEVIIVEGLIGRATTEVFRPEVTLHLGAAGVQVARIGLRQAVMLAIPPAQGLAKRPRFRFDVLAPRRREIGPPRPAGPRTGRSNR